MEGLEMGEVWKICKVMKSHIEGLWEGKVEEIYTVIKLG